MDNFQKAALLFSELKRELKLANKEDRQYLDILKIALDKIDAKEKLIAEGESKIDEKV
ncbi:hypothetical protein [Carnobacterium maltaromaticum]|uniref:hypothetical protein n=1 Tax=Carnobacterium maltaromaticum TaxID=2751 RepID=UPI0012F719E1|nr:hypothetical protein [Carnobacterium maltaromaticum]